MKGKTPKSFHHPQFAPADPKPFRPTYRKPRGDSKSSLCSCIPFLAKPIQSAAQDNRVRKSTTVQAEEKVSDQADALLSAACSVLISCAARECAAQTKVCGSGISPLSNTVQRLYSIVSRWEAKTEASEAGRQCLPLLLELTRRCSMSRCKSEYVMQAAYLYAFQ